MKKIKYESIMFIGGILFTVSLLINGITWAFFGFDVSGWIIDVSDKWLRKYE